jgi:Fe-S cluster assembly iron-binding protein IscA
MLSVTSAAKEKLKNDLQTERKAPDSLVRLAPASDDPQKFGFTLDKEKKGDLVIEDNEGEKLLLIDEDVNSLLTEAVLDYADKGQGLRFTLTNS